MFFFYYFQDFKGTTAKSMADVQKCIEIGLIKIGTKYKVAPIAPLKNIYYHVGMVTNIKENGVEVFHLKKNLFQILPRENVLIFRPKKMIFLILIEGLFFFIVNP